MKTPDTTNPCMHGAEYARTHAQSVHAILGNKAPPITSSGSQFLNRDRWTLRFFAAELTAWALKNPKQLLTPATVELLVQKTNDTPVPKREILIAETPQKLDMRTALALTGGAYHEAWHTLWSHRAPLNAQEMFAMVSPHWGKIPNWGPYLRILLDVMNLVEDIRIERNGCRDFPGSGGRMHDLQDFILKMEDPGLLKMSATGAIVCIFRDLGLGYQTDRQKTRLDWYRTKHPEAYAFVEQGPLAGLLDQSLHLSKNQPLACLDLAMQVVAILVSEKEKKAPPPPPPPPPPPAPTPQEENEDEEEDDSSGSESEDESEDGAAKGGESGDDDSEDEEGDSEEGAGGKGGEAGDESKEGESEGDESEDEEGESKDEGAGDEGSSDDSESEGDESEGDEGGDSESEGGESEGEGGAKGKDGSGASEGNEDNATEGDDEDGEGDGEEETEGAFGVGRKSESDKGESEEGGEALPQPADAAGTEESGSGGNSAGGQAKNDPVQCDWSELLANLEQEIKNGAGLIDANAALASTFTEIREKELQREGGVQRGEARYVADPKNHVVVVAQGPRDKARAEAIYATVKSEATYLRARLRQVIRALMITGVTHGVPKGRMLSPRFLVDTKIQLQDKKFPHRAYAVKDEDVDTMMSAAIVLDESGSMETWRVEATRILLALTEPLDALGYPVLVTGFQEMGSIRHRIFKTFDEPLRAVKGRFANTAADGGTPLADGIQYALEGLNRRNETHRFLFVITDGVPNQGHGPMIQRQLRLASEAGIHVIGVGLGNSARYVTKVFPDFVWEEKISNVPMAVLRKLNELVDGKVVARNRRLQTESRN